MAVFRVFSLIIEIFKFTNADFELTFAYYILFRDIGLPWH